MEEKLRAEGLATENKTNELSTHCSVCKIIRTKGVLEFCSSLTTGMHKYVTSFG